MNRWLRAIFQPGMQVAPVPLVFLSIALVGILQVLFYLIIRWGMLSVGVLLNELVAIAGIPLVLIYVLRLSRTKLLPFRRLDMTAALLIILVTLGADITIDYLTAANERLWPLPENVKEALKNLVAVHSSAELLWKFFLLCIVPAVCEEIFFRGFCQTSLAAKLGVVKAVLVTALLFAALHGNPWYLHLYFLLGLLMGWVYAATGSLWASIICHVFNNAWTFVNSVRDFKLPVFGDFGWIDLVIILFAVVLFTPSAALLSRVSHKHL